MRVILFYAPTFWFKTFKKVLVEAAEQEAEAECHEAVVVFYQAEADDQQRQAKVLTKLIKNIKWLAGKFQTKTIVLHSFNHLSSSKAPPQFAEMLTEAAKQRLEQSGYQVTVTPFGYLNEWRIHVAGDSLAKVYKEL
ncbi:MAG: hypothetical protein JRJ12_15240 [Deltaproteobacteria bacterium]|nr:hypothetical protein [Deltaproteobacteria bacterium]MBW2072210.1 hypothetical protein [Deltaproteobacteria bacterium]